jgi:hypothetical protein
MIQQAHHNILHQLVVMETYIDKHLEEIRAAHDGQRSEAWVQKQHKSSFTEWLKQLDIHHGEADQSAETLRGLHPTRPPKSPHGMGMTSMDTGSKQKRRTRRAQHRTAVFDMRASMSP